MTARASSRSPSLVRSRFLFLALVLGGLSSLGAPRPAFADGADGASTTISILTESTEGGGSWIRSDTELVRAYPLPLGAFKAVLEDFEAYPRFLPRLVRTTVLSRDRSCATIRQRYEIAILGYRYPTEYDLALVIAEDRQSGSWNLSWNLAGTDGSVGASAGSWTLESYVDAEGQRGTRVTHRNHGVVRKKFPLQEPIMRAVAAKELGRSIDAVYQEAYRRSSTVTRSSAGME